MAKTHVRYCCTDCGHEELRWLGRCPGCGVWNTMAEVKIAPAAGGRNKGARGYSAGATKVPAGRSGSVGFGGGVPGARPPVPLSEVASAEQRRRVAACDEEGRRLAEDYATSRIGTRATALVETRRLGGLLTGFTGRYLRAWFEGGDERMGEMTEVRITGRRCGGVTAEVVSP